MICMIAAGAYAGHRASQSLTRRVAQLEDVMTFLQLMSTQIRYTMPPLPTLFLELQGNTACQNLLFPEECAGLLGRDVPFPEAWKLSLDHALPMLAVKKQDLAPLYELGEQLGCTDVEGQLAIIALALQRMRQTLNEAQEYKRQNGGLYRTLGVLSGVFLILLTV
ncbi:stage III sporulation protein AB [Zongyangia hominis]|uniref:Stage III sporulation protein AB n=1 Tax=Zongyangia hominis TaxID=2763677 RepID=A0A926I637_9FIRM|nr:stage III sporulation protein AB [Zongyangia hominis]MBC8569609.1 stage III sporulation protein AB [Zongyangia hominis]